ncbi:hypothetical protein FTUN_8971 [Frigoriglobus tundricola]|uniref:Uncharacterized protein n=1 Tax=Frigoriglobus tundricola TaxID=2774151 RepID=A0A6M5Z639_9BACT|nr:hypothetical protein FTUN_8971 [Frigoriglobus tundricola]
MSSPDRPAGPPGEFTSVGLIGPGAARAALRGALAAYPLLEFDLERHPAPTAASTDPGRPGEPDALVVCASVALTAAHGADTTGVAATGRGIAARLRRGRVGLLGGPVPPGTTRGVLLPPLASNGRCPAQDFGLAYVSALPSAGAATALLNRTGIATTRVSSLETGEVCGAVVPLVRTIQAATRCELKVACARMGIDAGEVIGASGARTLLSAAAPGNHCCPRGARPSARSASRRTSTRRCPPTLLRSVTGGLDDAGRAVRGSHVSLVGADLAAGPLAVRSFELLELLSGRGAISATTTRSAPRSRGRDADRSGTADEPAAHGRIPRGAGSRDGRRRRRRFRPDRSAPPARRRCPHRAPHGTEQTRDDRSGLTNSESGGAADAPRHEGARWRQQPSAGQAVSEVRRGSGPPGPATGREYEGERPGAHSAGHVMRG